jgi:hypothetical protein
LQTSSILSYCINDALQHRIICILHSEKLFSCYFEVSKLSTTAYILYSLHNLNKSAYKSLVRPIPEYSVACLDPCKEGQINAVYRVQTIVPPFAYHMNVSDWETVAQRRTKARLCALFKAYSGELAWKTIREKMR